MRSLTLPSLLLFAQQSLSITLNPNSNDSIRQAAATVAGNVVKLYGNHTIPGIIEGPWYWWTSGLAWDSLVNYWAVTGDATHNTLVAEALIFQTGPNNDYLPPNQTKSLGNDDQSFWGLAAMTAAETNFPTVSGRNITWLQLAQNVFNTQVARWDTESCGGGLRWQIFSFNAGYNYKNSQSQGNFAQLASRLYHYTGNQTYLDWAQKAVDWSRNIGLVTDGGDVYDGTDATMNCSDVNKLQWTATLGAYLNGAAYASNATRAESWSSLQSSLQSGSDIFVRDGVITEVACAPSRTCNTDQTAFRAILARAYARASQLISPLDTRTDALKKSAQAAGQSCTGGQDGTSCATSDGSLGLGAELSALELFLANLPGPVLRTANTSSPSTVNAGSGNSSTTSTAPGASNTGNAGVITKPLTLTGLGALLAWAVML